jgi:AP-2 complex subunit alpha
MADGQIVFDADMPPEYIYYKVPNPWMQVKLLRLLQYYPPPGESMIADEAKPKAHGQITTRSSICCTTYCKPSSIHAKRRLV